jgi:hypothetical protein
MMGNKILMKKSLKNEFIEIKNSRKNVGYRFNFFDASILMAIKIWGKRKHYKWFMKIF